MENINNLYFDGFYKEIWRSTVPEEVTAKETSFFMDYFKLSTRDLVLDLMCGYGRHAISLGRNGVKVTAVDNLKSYTSEIQLKADAENLPITVVNADILNFQPKDQASLAICMGNSLNFFSEPEIAIILKKIWGGLISGGSIVINSWSLTEIVAKAFVSKYWTDVDGIRFLSDSRYLFQPTRVETLTTMIAKNGKTELKTAIDYVFAVSEYERMLNHAGFEMTKVFSIPGRKEFSIGDPRAYIVARK